MSIQTPAEKITGQISDLARSATAHLENLLVCLNSQTQVVVNADSDALAEWLNSRGARLEDDLTRHGLTGGAANALAALMESATGTTLPRVDVSPFADKLAATGRTATLTAQGWVVADIPAPDAPQADLMPTDDPQP